MGKQHKGSRNNNRQDKMSDMFKGAPGQGTQLVIIIALIALAVGAFMPGFAVTILIVAVLLVLYMIYLNSRN